MSIAAPFLLAFAVSLVLVPFCGLGARRLGFVARPREDRWHRREIAMLGGVGIGGGLFVSMLVYGDARQLGVLTVAASIIFLTGLVDDIWPLKPATKLVIEIGVASLFL